MLRVLVGAQAAPASHASSRRGLITHHRACRQIFPCRRCHRAQATTCLRGADSDDSTSAPDSVSTASRGRDPLRKPYARHRSRPAGLCSQQACALTQRLGSATPAPSPRPIPASSARRARAPRRRHPHAAPRPPSTAAPRPARRVACSDFHGPQPRCSSTQSNMLLRPVLSLPRGKWHGAIGTWDENYSKRSAADTSERHSVWRVWRDMTNQPTPAPDSLRGSARERHIQTQHVPTTSPESALGRGSLLA
jgi:hypothetical protein